MVKFQPASYTRERARLPLARLGCGRQMICRRAGEQFADGGLFSHGWQGPAWSNVRKPALRLKARQLPQLKSDRCSTLSFPPSTLAGEDGLQEAQVMHLGAASQSWGFSTIQFNVVDRKMLLGCASPSREAQELVVRRRVFGALWSSKAIQDDIINRSTEHVL